MLHTSVSDERAEMQFPEHQKSTCAADVVFLAETRLTALNPSDSYQIQGFKIACRNDQDWNEHSRPSHGIICYVRDIIWVLEIQKRSCEVLEAIFVCLQHPSLPNPVQLKGIYLTPIDT